LTAALLRLFLRLISCFYLVVILLRNLLYDKGWLKTYTPNTNVISVGNITAGGTGKTPLVIWLCRFFRQKNIRCAILTRGYKTKEGRLSDEPAILAERCPQAGVVVNPDRAAGAAEAVERLGADVLIMDDGFQHRRLNRNLDIVAIDATLPFGYKKMLPAGLLREPVTALKRADAVVITRCDQISGSELNKLEEKLQLINPDMVITRAIHAAVCAKSTNNREISLVELRNKKVYSFCGIGNPDAFVNTIKGLGTNLVGSKVYNDHHNYRDSDTADIYEEATYLGTDLVLTTEKDWKKIAVLPLIEINIPFAYLAVELKFLAGEDRLTGLIEDALGGKITTK